jgi:hypothetical protein
MEPVVKTGMRGRPAYVERKGRREYQRQLMRERRARLKAQKEAGK